MADVVINIDMDKKCAECGKGGAVPSGICLKCTSRALSGKPMKSRQGQAVQKRFKQSFAAHNDGKESK